LLKLAGRPIGAGDSRNEMLQRIYGHRNGPTAKDLKGYLDPTRGKRSAATIASSAKQMDLFHFQDEAVGRCLLAREGLGRCSARSSSTLRVKADCGGIHGGQHARS